MRIQVEVMVLLFLIGFLTGGALFIGAGSYWLMSSNFEQKGDPTLPQEQTASGSMFNRIANGFRTQHRVSELHSQMIVLSERIAALEIERSRELLVRIRDSENDHPNFLLKRAVTESRISSSSRPL
jgi:hypothetical protein